MGELVALPASQDNEQTFLFHMPVKEVGFKLEGGAGFTDAAMDYDQHVSGTFEGRVAGQLQKNGKLTLIVEVLECNITEVG